MSSSDKRWKGILRMIEVYKNGDINDKLTGGKVESFLTESKIDVKMRDDLQETFHHPLAVYHL